MQEMWIRPLGQEDNPGERNGNHSSILAWEIPWIEEADGLQFSGSQEPDTTWQLNHHQTTTACI